MTAAERTVRVGIDVGGTFTDFVAITGDGALLHLKEASTPDDPSLAVLSGLGRVIEQLGVARPEALATVAHGTTIGLNAIIQRAGAPVALVVSRGHRDVLELTRRLPKEFDLRQPHVQALVPRDRVIEIDARLDAHGARILEPDDAEITRVAQRIRATGAGAAAVTVLHSYLDPEFEAGVAARLTQALPGVNVTSSAAIWPEIREYNRASAVALNATITPLIGSYLDALERRIRELGIEATLSITASNGGSIDVGTARQRPIDTILSGPASGVTASLQVAERNAVDTLISFDMGGTSSDIAVVVHGAAEFTGRTEVGGLPLILPVVDVNAIGAGGGSIARIDDLGGLQVGPQSAGAAPGPAAYGRGGSLPTVTDAYVVTGIVDPERFLGGEQRLDAAAAHRAFEPVAEALGYSGADATTRAAADVLAVAAVSMSSELQKVLARRGFDAAEATLLPFGGAGPTHAALLAEETGIDAILVPLSAGTFCALGAVAAPLRRDYLRGVGRPLGEQTVAMAGEHLRELFTSGRDWLAGQPTAIESTVSGGVEMRYVGQAFELLVPLGESDLPLAADDLAERFHVRHEQEFGHRDTVSGITIVSVTATALGAVEPVPAVSLPEHALPREPEHRQVFLGGAWHEARVLGADDLAADLSIPGPAVVDLSHTTVLVPPGWSLRAGVGDALRLSRGRASGIEATR